MLENPKSFCSGVSRKSYFSAARVYNSVEFELPPYFGMSHIMLCRSWCTFFITSPLIEVSHLFCAPIWLECRATSSLPNSSNSSGRGRVVGSSHRQRTRDRILTMMRLTSSKGPRPMAFDPESLRKRPGRASLICLCLLLMLQIWRDRSLTAPLSTSLALSQPPRLPCQWLILWERAC